MADNKKKPKKVKTSEKKAPRKWSERDNDARRIRQQKKTQFLLSQNIDITGLRYKDINKVKMSEVNTGILSTQTRDYFLKLKTGFDFDKIINLSPHKLYVAYQDYAEENSLNDIIANIGNMSIEDIIERINILCNTPSSYVKGKSNSSGKAGEAIFSCTVSSDLMEDFINVRSTNRHINHLHRIGSKKVKTHSGAYKGYQTLKGKDGKSTTTKITPRHALEILLALMDNVTELDRPNIHFNFMIFCKDHMPELLEYISDHCAV